MPEWSGLLFWPAYLYLMAVAAGALALALRAARPRPTLTEARGRVLLAPVAALFLPLWTSVLPHFGMSDQSFHQLWHGWEEAVHGTVAIHGLLHLVNVVLFGAVLVSLVRVAAGLARERTFSGALAACGERALDRPELPLYRLSSGLPVCFTVGWFRPRVYLSRSLEDQLSPEAVTAMLAHEREHVHRRDPLFRGLLGMFYSLFPIPDARLLLEDWSRAAEHACDTSAATAVGRLSVAQALLDVAGVVFHSRPMAGAVQFTGAANDIERRVHALLHPDRTSARPMPRWIWAAAPLLVAAAPLLQHLTELLVHH